MDARNSSPIYVDEIRIDGRDSASPSNHRGIAQEQTQSGSLSRSEGLEPDINMRDSSSIYVDETRSERRGIASPSNHLSIAQRQTQSELLPRPTGSETGSMIYSESLLPHRRPKLDDTPQGVSYTQPKESGQSVDVHDASPIHINEAMINMRSSASSSTHQNAIRGDPPLSCEGPRLTEVMQDPQLNWQNEVIASTSASAHLSPHESETMPRMSEEVDAVSPIHYSIGSDTNDSWEEYNATTSGEGSFLSGSIQQENVSTAEEPVMDTIIENAEVEEHSSPSSASILKPLSGLEMSGFVSEIRTRVASSSKGRFSRNLGNIMTTLRELVLGISIEAVPELTEFRDMINSLLDCAVISGIDAQELQHWETMLREVEFGIYSIQIALEENSIEENETAKAAYEDISERAMFAYDNLSIKHKAAIACQQRMMWAVVEVEQITTEIKYLQQKKQYLIQEREMIKQEIAVMEGDFMQIRTDISELEPIYAPLSKQLEVASQHLQVIQDKHEYKAAQAKAAMARIRGIQSRCA